MTWISGTSALGLLACCAITSPVAAQEDDVEDAEESPEEQAQSPEERAMELFQESADRYREGEFDQAASLLEEAYRLDPASVLLYNLARAYEGMGELGQAIDAYEGYLEQEPDAGDRGSIERRLETLRAQHERLQREETDGPDRTNGDGPDGPDAGVPPPPAGGVSAAPWIIAGAGVLVVGAGVAFGLMAQSAHDDAVQDPDFVPAVDRQDEAETFATVANISFIAGGVLAAVGVVWGVVDVLGSSDDVATVSLSPSGLRVRGTW